jgi:ABC-type spermidine/putrescine transport system permease subunit I
VIAFPLAYFIAFKAGRWKNFMLLLSSCRSSSLRAVGR